MAEGADRLIVTDGITEAIEQEGGIQWGGERLYSDGRFQTEDGRAKLFAIEWEPFPVQESGRRRFCSR